MLTFLCSLAITGIFTRDLHRAYYAYEHLEVGGVVINDIPSVRVDAQPVSKMVLVSMDTRMNKSCNNNLVVLIQTNLSKILLMHSMEA